MSCRRATGSRPLAEFFSKDVAWRVPASNPHIKPHPRIGHAAVMNLLQSGVEVYEAGSMNFDMQPTARPTRMPVVLCLLCAQWKNARPNLRLFGPTWHKPPHKLQRETSSIMSPWIRLLVI
jgi:hypothetical protein